MAPDAGALRATEALFSSNGAFTVTLRLPGLAVSGSDAEQLGLSAPVFADVPVGPAAWQRAGETKTLLLAAEAVVQVAGSQEVGAAMSVFEAAVGLVVSGVLYRITGCEPMLMAGVACAYRLTLEEPAW